MEKETTFGRLTGITVTIFMIISLMVVPVTHAADDETEEFTLSIMHMNDTHAHVEPMPKMVTAIKEIRQENPEALLLHAGDVFSGTLYFNEFKGQADLAMLNLMNVDAMTFGNHEFDLGDQEEGHESLAKFVEGAQFPFVSSNVDFSGDQFMGKLVTDDLLTEEPDNGKIYDSIIKEIDGEKVGIFGLTTEDTKDIASPVNVTFTDYQKAAEDAVADFEGAGINKVIAVTHMGYDSNPAVGNDLLLAQIDGIDIIVGGHSHTKLEQPVVVDNDASGREKDPTVVVQAYQYADFLGTLDVTFDEDGVVSEFEGKLLDIDNYDADAEATEALQKYTDQIDGLMKEEIDAKALKDLPNPRQDKPGDDSVRATETALGNLVSDAMLAKGKEVNSEVVIAVQNGGGIREAIPRGPITVGEVISVLPFGNNPVTMEISGAELKEALEHSVSQAPSESGGFLHVSGMKFTYDSKADVGSRVQSMELAQDGNYIPIDEAKKYVITTNAFTAQGGDGFDVFKKAYDEGRVSDTGEIDWEQLRDYMEEDLEGQVDPEIEGRIVDLKGEKPDDDNEEDPGEDPGDKDEDGDDDGKTGGDGDQDNGSGSGDDDNGSGTTPSKNDNNEDNQPGKGTQHDGDKLNNNDENGSPLKSTDKKDGAELPKTATNMFSFILFGSILIVAGGVLIFLRKKHVQGEK